jgi:cyclophilin family peptidyl-prolyl cis-trans isomerase
MRAEKKIGDGVRCALRSSPSAVIAWPTFTRRVDRHGLDAFDNRVAPVFEGGQVVQLGARGCRMTDLKPKGLLLLLLLPALILWTAVTATPTQAQQRLARPQTAKPAAKPGAYKTPLTLDQMKQKQAVLTTSAGTIVMQLLPEVAPNHVGYFMELAQKGSYNGTTFHRAVLRGIVQGGDPLSKDPAKKALYGTGGLGVLKSEVNAEKHTRGAVSAVLQPGRPDSAGAQFFISVSDQPSLDGQFTVFARVVEGIDVAQKISESPADAEGRLNDRIEITAVTIRDTPPPEPVPFEGETPAQLARWRAVLETTMGAITLEFAPEKAPEHVRNFLRLAKTGVYDGTAFHRVVPGFVIQGGAMTSRREPPAEKQRAHIKTTIAPEFNDTLHTKGIVSMARGDDPSSASTSFFICTGPAPSLDNKYTVFGRVVDGLPVVEAIEQAPRNGEEPVTRIEILKVRVEPKD